MRKSKSNTCKIFFVVHNGLFSEIFFSDWKFHSNSYRWEIALILSWNFRWKDDAFTSLVFFSSSSLSLFVHKLQFYICRFFFIHHHSHWYCGSMNDFITLQYTIHRYFPYILYLSYVCSIAGIDEYERFTITHMLRRNYILLKKQSSRETGIEWAILDDTDWK